MASFLLKTLRHHRALHPALRYASPLRAPPLATFSTSEAALPSAAPPPPFAATSSAAAASSDRGRERGTWSKLLLFLPGAITFGLGTWQIVRRREKIEMLEYRRKRLEMEPIMWNSLSSYGEDLSALEFRKVLCEGFFDESKSIYVGPRSRSISGVTENGYYVVTPLIPTSNDSSSEQPPILVNRGWVPRDWRNKPPKNTDKSEESPSPTKDDEETEQHSWWKIWSKKSKSVKDLKTADPAVSPLKVIGVIRGSEKPSIFVPENSPSSGQWFYVDVPMIAHAAGLPENTLYIEDINEDVSASNPYPIPKDVNTLINHSVMPQDHLNYTFTWYTLSAAVTFMAFKRIRTSRSRR